MLHYTPLDCNEHGRKLLESNSRDGYMVAEVCGRYFLWPVKELPQRYPHMYQVWV